LKSAYASWFARRIDVRIIKDFNGRVTGFVFNRSELMPDWADDDKKWLPKKGF
jgi:hypothetical protein